MYSYVGCVWLCSVVYGSVVLCMAMEASVWLCSVVYGYVSLYVAM